MQRHRRNKKVTSVTQGNERSRTTVTLEESRVDKSRLEKKREEENTPSPPQGGIGRIGEFEKFWEVYPIRKAKQAAISAFKKIRPSHDLVQAMIRAIGEQQSERALLASQGRFVPEWKHPATWLNAR